MEPCCGGTGNRSGVSNWAAPRSKRIPTDREEFHRGKNEGIAREKDSLSTLHPDESRVFPKEEVL